jgi:LL-diaminopimelate aminotransferase
MPILKTIVEPSDRIMRLPASLGSEFSGIKRRLSARGVNLIDLGTLSPSVPPIVSEFLMRRDPPRPLSRLEADSVEKRLKEKISEWILSRFDVRFEPDREIMMTTGNTPAVFCCFQAFLGQGDRAYIPDPSYLLYRSAALAAGAEVVTYELSPRTDFLPNLEKLRATGSRSSKVLLVNYPHNPTSSVADEVFYERLVKFARKNNLLVLSDAVYNTHVWGRHAHPALAATPGAKFSSVELFTFSFMFNFPMLKLGFAVGCAEFLSPIGKLLHGFNIRPSGYDLQAADILMDSCEEIVGSVAGSLGENRQRFESYIAPLGWELQPSHATPFVWIKLPRRRLSLNFSRMLLKRTGVLVLPGISFGEMGEGFMRLSISKPPDVLDAAVSRIREHSKIYQRRYRRQGDSSGK